MVLIFSSCLNRSSLMIWEEGGQTWVTPKLGTEVCRGVQHSPFCYPGSHRGAHLCHQLSGKPWCSPTVRLLPVSSAGCLGAVGYEPSHIQEPLGPGHKSLLGLFPLIWIGSCLSFCWLRSPALPGKPPRCCPAGHSLLSPGPAGSLSTSISANSRNRNARESQGLLLTLPGPSSTISLVPVHHAPAPILLLGLSFSHSLHGELPALRLLYWVQYSSGPGTH